MQLTGPPPADAPLVGFPIRDEAFRVEWNHALGDDDGMSRPTMYVATGDRVVVTIPTGVHPALVARAQARAMGGLWCAYVDAATGATYLREVAGSRARTPLEPPVVTAAAVTFANDRRTDLTWITRRADASLAGVADAHTAVDAVRWRIVAG